VSTRAHEVQARFAFTGRNAWLVVLAAAPLLVQWALKTRLWPRPFWIHFYDPETIYFYEGLRLLRGLSPQNVDHPGTPLQILSAAVAFLTGPTPRHYEGFLLVAHGLIAFSLLAGTALLLATLFREAAPIVKVVAVWTWAMLPGSLERVDVWSPESLYFVSGAVVLALLWKYLQTPALVWAVAVGVACGFAMGMKIVMIGVAAGVVIALIVQRRWGHAFVAALSVAIGFGIATLPAIMRWPHMLSRILALTGDPHWNDSTWTGLLGGAKGWLLWLIAVFVLAARGLRRHPALIAFGVTVIAVTVLGNLKSPSPRHLLPHGIGVLALLAAGAPLSGSTIARRTLIGSAALAALLTVKTMENDLATHRRRIAHGIQLRQRIHSALPAGASVLWSWRVPEPSFALRVMASTREDGRTASRLFPRNGFYDIWNGRIERPVLQDWNTLVIERKELPAFPEPLGRTLAEIDSYLIVARK